MSKNLYEESCYSDFSFAIDLVMNIYQTSNPIILAEKIEEDLGLEFTIHQIADYLDINKMEDYEKESNKQNYKINNYE